MSTDVIPVTPDLRGLKEGLIGSTIRSPLRAGAVSRSARWSQAKFRAQFQIVCPPNDKAALFAFFDAHDAGAESFLYKASDPDLSEIADEAAGTGTGSQTDFPLAKLHIDASTVVVEIDGTPQGSGWSLVGNDSAPLIRFTVAPASLEVVTVSYEYYWPVLFITDALVFAPFTTLDGGVYRADLALEQDNPGSHLA